MANQTTSSSILSNFYTVGTNGSVWSTSGIGNYSFTNSSINATSTNHNGGMTVAGNLEVFGGITVNGKDVVKLMEKIEDRLAILIEPSQDKLEKFSALKKAYDHYKLMEKLIGEE